MKRYASLTGPLIGLYYPIPAEMTSGIEERVALNTSKLKSLWCSIYDEKEVDRQIAEFGGVKLPDKLARSLDYDAYEVDKAMGRVP